MSNQPIDRDTLEHVRHDHARLHTLLGDTRRRLTQREETVNDVATMLGSVCEHLVDHFKLEEDGGFFQQLTAQAPRLSDIAETLEEEHVHLLETAQSLAKIAREGDGSDSWWSRLETDFLDFSKRMLQHEAKEHDLLQQAYGEDIGSHD